jgi:acetyltransferase-like isoleucine patch superfamily enzyme
MKNFNTLQILGFGAWLDYATFTARDLGYWEKIESIGLKKINSYTFDISDFVTPESGNDYFLAIDGAAYGTVREKHLSDLILRGFNFVSLIPEGKSKNISAINCLISSGVKINYETVKIQFNTLIGPNTVISSKFSAGRSVTIDPNTLILEEVRLGKNVTIQNVSKILNNITVEEYSLVQTLKEIKSNITAHSIYSETFEKVVRIKKN